MVLPNVSALGRPGHHRCKVAAHWTMQLFWDHLKGVTHEAWYDHVSCFPMVQPDCQLNQLVKLYSKILCHVLSYGDYTLVSGFSLVYRQKWKYHRQTQNNYLMGHISAIPHQYNFAEIEAIENSNPMIEACDDDVGKWNQ